MANEGSTKPTYSELEAENLRVRGLLQRRWISVEERLPEAKVDVLLWLVMPTDAGLAEYRKVKGFAVGHLEVNGYGDIITRPITAPGETFRQWPAWEIAGDNENYHEASHWAPLFDPPNFPQSSSLISQGAESADIGKLDTADKSGKVNRVDEKADV